MERFRARTRHRATAIKHAHAYAYGRYIAGSLKHAGGTASLGTFTSYHPPSLHHCLPILQAHAPRSAMPPTTTQLAALYTTLPPQHLTCHHYLPTSCLPCPSCMQDRQPGCCCVLAPAWHTYHTANKLSGGIRMEGRNRISIITIHAESEKKKKGRGREEVWGRGRGGLQWECHIYPPLVPASPPILRRMVWQPCRNLLPHSGRHFCLLAVFFFCRYRWAAALQTTSTKLQQTTHPAPLPLPLHTPPIHRHTLPPTHYHPPRLWHAVAGCELTIARGYTFP